MNDTDDLVRAIRPMVERIRSLHRDAVRAYTPIVEDIVRSGSRDVQHIEHTLTWLLDFCSSPEALVLYNRLCRHYWTIDPAATAFYIQAYREMWGSESEGQGEPEPESQPQASDKRPEPRGSG
ncbi:MAG: hypothetical protein ACYC61_27395 [Isosphaeraceae bacterium]